jgi:hypothetical protein
MTLIGVLPYLAGGGGGGLICTVMEAWKATRRVSSNSCGLLPIPVCTQNTVVTQGSGLVLLRTYTVSLDYDLKHGMHN